MMIYKINPSVDYNMWLKRLDTQLNEPIKQNSILKSRKYLREENYNPYEKCKR